MTRHLTCPSARAEFDGSEIIGIVLPGDSGRQVQFLPDPVPVTDEIRRAGGSLPLAEFLRVAAPCAESRCLNFADGSCAVATSVREGQPTVEALPRCNVRASCRWFRQEGRDVCFRCPAVVTDALIAGESS